MANFLSKLFGGSNPANAAMLYLNQIPGVGQQYYSPYIQAGQQAGQQAGNTYQQMVSNPNAFYEQLRSGYTPSEGYKYNEEKLRKAMQTAAAAGGFSGAKGDQEYQADMIRKLLGQDQQQYFENVLGLLGGGLSGQQHIADQGYQASGSLADLLGSTLATQGELAFQGQANKNKSKQDVLSLLASALGTGAGFMLGGPAGAMAGSAIGGSLGGGGSPISSGMYSGMNAKMYGQNLPIKL